MENIKAFLRILGIAKRDRVARLFFYFVLWLIISLIAHVFSFHNHQIQIYEISFLRWFGTYDKFTLWEIMLTFPFATIFAPLILLFTHLVYLKIQESCKKLEALPEKQFTFAKRSIKWKFSYLNYLIEPLSIVFYAATPFVLVDVFFNNDPKDSKILISVSLIVYAAGIGLLNEIINPERTDIKLAPSTNSEAMKKSLIGVSLSYFSVAIFLFFLSVASLVERNSKYLEPEAIKIPICSKLSLIGLNDGANRLGWLISKGPEFWTIREKKAGIYRTVDLPTSLVKEIIYYERIGSKEERMLAFPKCFN